MEYLEIEGGNPLYGEVRIQGSKNAALPILSAVILHRGTTVLRNCPKIIDVLYMLEILKGFGCRVSWEGEALVIEASDLAACQVAECYGRQMRSSIMLLGSLLGRMKQASVSYPGGCVIGERPIDIHLGALEKLGAVFAEEPSGLKAVCEKPVGLTLRLPFPSVGATENVILLAASAEGTTVLENAAMEPEIGELCRFLNSMGAKIRGMGTDKLVIDGVREFHDTEFTIMPDRIVAGTYMLMTAAAGGDVRLLDVPLEQLGSVRKVLGQMGARQEAGEELTWDEAAAETECCVSRAKGVPGAFQGLSPDPIRDFQRICSRPFWLPYPWGRDAASLRKPYLRPGLRLWRSFAVWEPRSRWRGRRP